MHRYGTGSSSRNWAYDRDAMGCAGILTGGPRLIRSCSTFRHSPKPILTPTASLPYTFVIGGKVRLRDHERRGHRSLQATRSDSSFLQRCAESMPVHGHAREAAFARFLSALGGNRD